MPQPEHPDIKTLHRQRGSVKRKLTSIKKFVDTIISDQSISIDNVVHELQLRANDQSDMMNKFNEVQSVIECVCDDNDLEKEYQERDEFESQYYEVSGLLNRLIEQFSSSQNKIQANSSSRSNGSEEHGSINTINNQSIQGLKLPTIHLPKYAGDFTNWLEFKDIYISLIHGNSSISAIQKFHYLRASLEGTAAQVIKSIEFSATNYSTAWDLLCDRYDNNHLLVHNHIQAIFDIPTITKNSSSSFRQMIDEVSKHLRSLDTLQTKEETFETIIIYILQNKLDIKTTKEWEERKHGETASLADFKEFLKNKADLFETLEARIPKKADNISNKTYKQKAFTSNISTCNYCKKNHLIYQCEAFLKMSVQDRLEQVRKLNVCFNCLRTGHNIKSCSSGGCRKCKARHNTLLHQEKESSQASLQQEASSPSTSQAESTFNASCRLHGQVLLATAQVAVQDKHGKYHNCRALLDCGSQSHFMTTRLCNKLELPKCSKNISIIGINQVTSRIKFECVTTVKSNVNNFQSKLSCFVIDTISEGFVSQDMTSSSWNIPANITLADPQFGSPGEIDILLGGALFWEILREGKIMLGKGNPVLQNTALGWIIAGNLQLPLQSEKLRCHFTQNLDIQFQLQKFWEIEEYPTANLAPQDKECEDIFAKTTKRDLHGRFVVAIPFKQNPAILGDSHKSAIKRFLSLEQRLQGQPQLKQLYTQFMQEYIDLGHMNVSTNQEEVQYYLPHHGVLKEESLTTKLRVVFDGSAVTDNGTSLNDIQFIGPNLQQDLISILIRFRQHNYVFTADITKMYRQILVRKEDRPLQKIIWRKQPDHELLEYELNTVTYGTRSAPYLAIRCIKQLGLEAEDNFPEASKIILRDFYVDDLLSGAETIEQAVGICNQITQILKTAGFELRKWSSNDKRVLQDINPDKHTSSLQDFGKDTCKTLGLQWSYETDKLRYKINTTYNKDVTKRSILSEASQIFDPLGLVAPCVIKVKTLLQKLWTLKVSWDDPIPTEIQQQWLQLRQDLTSLNTLRIKRHVICTNPISIELHGFCDSSQEAYGASIYIRSTETNGTVNVNLLCAKAKVAPLKVLSIPRLELCGALVLSRIMKQVQKSLSIQIQRIYYWTDSQIVLAWLKSESTSLQVFVANRVSEIQNLTDISEWNHVASKHNPADLLSRGIQPIHIQENNLWWHGPPWLVQNKNLWPISEHSEILVNDLPELKKQCKVYSLIQVQDYSIFNRYSSFKKLVQITALCLRFIQNLKSTNSRTVGTVSVQELNQARTRLLKLAQQQTFLQEIKNLQEKNELQRKSRLRNLCPFIDEEGLIRVGGRIQGSQLNYETRHPILLSGKHPISLLILRDLHHRLLHAGPQMLLFTSRENFWILQGRSLSKRVVHDCITCFKVKPTSITPLMGNLPAYRINPSTPFSITGTDYAGPFLLRDKLGRGKSKYKCYICIFICMVTKAVHLEPVTDLSTDSFISTLKRFIARRGVPTQLHSDNGTTYVKASKELAELGNFIIEHNDELANNVSKLGITWHFIPPVSPNFGGLWEAAVKSTKYHLKRILLNQCLPFEHFLTLLVTVEGILNSRPISPLSSDPNDLRPLTPGHFLIGRPFTAIPENNLENVPQNRLTLHKQIQQMKQIFWKRWSNEYITQLQVRSKWTKQCKSATAGMLVLLKDKNLPPTQWQLGRIIQCHPGPDGVTRVVTVKTVSGVYQRAISKVCPLPSDCESENQ